jgi:hypothetical protein
MKVNETRLIKTSARVCRLQQTEQLSLRALDLHIVHDDTLCAEDHIEASVTDREGIGADGGSQQPAET